VLAADTYVGPALRFAPSDVFCLDGQRPLLVSGSYGADGSEYRPELDPFTRITAIGGNNSANITAYTGPASFRVERRDGTTSTYGGTDDARLAVAECGGGTGLACANRQWALNRSEDSSGNYIDYVYAKWLDGAAVSATAAANEQQLIEVRYTGKRRLAGQTAPDAAPFARVLMSCAERPVTAQSAGWQAGASYRSTRELTGIGIFEPLATEIRHYALTHQDAPSGSGRRLLQRVQECTSSAKTLCYPATEFSVDPRSHALSLATDRQLSGSAFGPRRDFRIGDIDGDGRQDIVWARPATACGALPGVRVLFGDQIGAGAAATPDLQASSTAVRCRRWSVERCLRRVAVSLRTAR